MNEQNDSQKQAPGACGPGCACNASGSSKKTRWIVGAIVLVIAVALVARAVVKNNRVSSAPASTGFATLAVPAQTPAAAPAVAPPATNAAKEIASLMELNSVAADSVGVFVYLPGERETVTATKTVITQIRGAARTIEPQLNGGKIGVFTLKAGTQDYKQVALQMTVPGVLALVKGGGMKAASGDITETKLVQAFVAASSSGGCGSASGGCGPRGCN